MNLRQRIARLERHSPAASYATDVAEFDRLTDVAAASIPAAELPDMRKAWAISRQLIRSYPGRAPAFVGMTMEDFRL